MPGLLQLLVVLCVCVCVYLLLKLLITSGMMWHDMDPYDWLNVFYSCYMAAVFNIVSKRGLNIDTSCRNQPNSAI